MTTRETPRPRRGPDAVMAAVEEFEVRQRLDEPDGSYRATGELDLTWARDRIETARRAAEADVVTPEEALEWLSATVTDERTDEPEADEQGPDGS
ncbi:MAG: hypothetical protein R6U94_05290 [Nitriliruptoraceae bacterium]